MCIRDRFDKYVNAMRCDDGEQHCSGNAIRWPVVSWADGARICDRVDELVSRWAFGIGVFHVHDFMDCQHYKTDRDSWLSSKRWELWLVLEYLQGVSDYASVGVMYAYFSVCES